MEYTKLQRMAVMDKAVSCIAYEDGRSLYHMTRKNLAAARWRELGAGNYGSAWAHSDLPGYVVKVCGRVDGDSYPAWAYYCAANPAVGLPEYEFPTFSMDNAVFMVMMPEYTSAQELGYDNSQFTPEQLADWVTVERVLGYGYKPGALAQWNQRTNEYEPWNPEQTEFLTTLLRAAEFFGGKCQWDIHAGNVMIDKRNGQLVVTDPIHQGDNATLITSITGRPFRRQVHQVQLKLALEAPRQARPVALPPGLHEIEFGDFNVVENRIALGNPNRQQLPKLGDKFRFQVWDDGQFPKLHGGAFVPSEVASPRELAAWVYEHSLKGKEQMEILDLANRFNWEGRAVMEVALMREPIHKLDFRRAWDNEIPAVQHVQVPRRMALALQREHEKRQRVIADFQRGAQALRRAVHDPR